MPLFPGPVQLANEQWVRNLSSADKSIRFAPTKEDSDAWKEQIQLQKARNYLSTGVLQQQMQEQRAQLVSQGILLNRQNNPPPAQMVNQRSVPRLTIADINKMSIDDIKAQVAKMGQNQMDDHRSAGMKFLDLIDLPRNSVFNIAFTDEGSVEEAALGLSIATGVGSVIGGTFGAIGGAGAGGIGAIPGAIAGAKGGAIWGASVYSGTMAIGSTIGSFLDDEDKASIRKESLERETGALGKPKVYFSQVLDRLGMEKGVARGILGFAGDVLMDPLSWQTKPISVLWSGGARIGAVHMTGAGVKNVRHFADKVLKEGIVDQKTGLIKLADNSPYKELESLWNSTIRVGDDIHNIAPGIDLAKRTTNARKVLDEFAAKGTKATKKDLKSARKRLENAIQQDILYMSHYVDDIVESGAKGMDDFLTAGAQARGFLERFQVKSQFGLTVPFADWIAPSLRRKTNYRDLGVNISFGGRTGPKGRAFKALGKTDQAFIAAEKLKRASRLAVIAKQLGQYESIKMVKRTSAKGKAFFKKQLELRKLMPKSLQDKIHFTRTHVDLGADTPQHLKHKNKYGIRVDVTELTEQEARWLSDNGWQFEYTTGSGFDKTGEELFRVLKSNDDLQKVNYHKSILQRNAELAHTTPKIQAAEKRLRDALARDESLRETLDIAEEGMSPVSLDPAVQRELREINKPKTGIIAKAKKEIDELSTRKSLTDKEMERLLSEGTSMVLTEVNAQRGVHFAGEMLGVARGPGYLQRAFGGHTAETNRIADQIARTNAEVRRVKRELKRNLKAVEEGNATKRHESLLLGQRLNELQKQKDALINVDLSDEALEAAEKAQKAFNYTDDETEALAMLMEMSAQAAKKMGLTADEHLKFWFGEAIAGGIAAPGSEVLYQTMSKTPKVTDAPTGEAIAFLSRSGINVGDEAALTNANQARAQVGLGKAGRLLENVGNKIAEATGGHVRLTAGVRLASNRASRAEGLMNGTIVAKLNGVNSADDAELAAITMAMVAKENGATIFHIDDTGKNTLVTLSGDAINGRNRGKVAKEIKALGLNIDTTTYHIGDNGEIHFILKGGRQEDELAKINKLGYKDVKTQKGTIKTVEAPLIKIEGATDATEGTRQAAQRYLYGRAKELQDLKEEGRSGLFSVLGNLVENEGLYLRRYPHFETDVEMAIHSIRGLNILGADKVVKGGNWLKFLQNAPKKGDVRLKSQWNFTDSWSGEMSGIPEQRLRWLGVDDYLRANSDKVVTAEDILKVIEKNKFTVHLDEFAEGAITAERHKELLTRSKQRSAALRYEIEGLDESINKAGNIETHPELLRGLDKGDMSTWEAVNALNDFLITATHGKLFRSNRTPLDTPRLTRAQVAEHMSSEFFRMTSEVWEANTYYKIQDMSLEEKVLLRKQIVKRDRLKDHKFREENIQHTMEKSQDYDAMAGYAQVTETMGDNHKLFMIRTSENAAQGSGSHMAFNTTNNHMKNEPGMIGHVRVSDQWLEVDGVMKKFRNIEEVQSDAANYARQIHDDFVHNYAKKYGITVSKESPDLKASLLKSGKLSEAEELLLKSDGYYSEKLLDTVSRMSPSEIKDTGTSNRGGAYFLVRMPEKPPGLNPGSEIYDKAVIRRILKMTWEETDANYAGVTIGNGSKLDVVQMHLNKSRKSEELKEFPLRDAISQRRQSLGFAADDLGIQYRIAKSAKGNYQIETQFVDKDRLFPISKSKQGGDMMGDPKNIKDVRYRDAVEYALSIGHKKKDLKKVITFDEKGSPVKPTTLRPHPSVRGGHWVVKGKAKEFRHRKLQDVSQDIGGYRVERRTFNEAVEKGDINGLFHLLDGHIGRARAKKVLFDSETGLFGKNKEMPWTNLESPYMNQGIGRAHDVTLKNNLLAVGTEMDGLSVQFSNHTGAPIVFGDDFIDGGGIEMYHSWMREASPWQGRGLGGQRARPVDARPLGGGGNFPSVMDDWSRATDHQLENFPELWAARQAAAKQYSDAMYAHGIRVDATGRIFQEDLPAWHRIVDEVYNSFKQVKNQSGGTVSQEFLDILGFSRRVDKVQKPIIAFTKETGKWAGERGSKFFHTAKDGTRRASIEFAADGKATIRALNAPDLGSYIHEMGHIARRALPTETVKSIAKRLGVKDWKNWTEAEEELFAGVFMDYVQKHSAPSPELVEPFELISDIMRKNYTNNYDKPISKSLRGELDEFFGGTPASRVKADEYKDVNNQLNSAQTAKNKVDAEINDGTNEAINFQQKMDSAEEEAEKVLEPLRETLATRKKSIRHKAANVALVVDRVIENVTGVGRRGKHAGEAVQRLKHGVENKAAFYTKLISKETDKSTKELAKRYGMQEDEAHKLLYTKVMEKEEAIGRQGLHPSSGLIDQSVEGNIYQIMDKYGGKARIWDDATLNKQAEKIQKLQKDYGLSEAMIKGQEVDIKVGYMPLRLTPEAEKAARKQAALLRSSGATEKPVSLTHGAQMARATNRHYYPVADPALADWVEEVVDPVTGLKTVRGWKYIYSKEVAEAMDAGTTAKLPQDYQAYRLAQLRENPSKMEGGDIWAYNESIRKSYEERKLLVDESKLLPGEVKPGEAGHTYYQVPAHPTDPFELNRAEVRSRWTSLVGADYSDAIFETNVSLMVAGRTQQHWRMDAVNQFITNLMPEMKVLKSEEVQDYIANPRNGVATSSVAGEVVINNITYRRLDETVRDNSTLRTLFGEDSRNMWYPEDVARAMDDYVKQISDDENLTAIGKVFDYVQSIWKGSVLMHPAWTTVNVLGGVIHSVVVGKVSPAEFAENFMTARKMAHEFHFGNRRGGFIPGGDGFIFNDANKYTVGGREMNETEFVQHLVEINAIDGSQTAREMFMLHRTAFGNPSPQAQKDLAEQIRYVATLGPLGAWWFKLNASIDDTFRTTVYLAARNRGESVEGASLLMKKAHFDYGDFTRYEESIGRRVIPFYAWQRNNVALQAKLLFEKPGYANSYQKIKHAVEEEGLNEDSKIPNFMLPRWLKNQLILQLSNDEGKTKGLVIGNLTPIQELIEIGQTVYGGEGFQEMWNYLLSSSSPILKTPIEWGMGRQIFNGRMMGDPDFGEKSIVQHMIDQVGYYSSLKGLGKAYMRDGMEGILYQMMIRGRFQPLDIDRLQAQISIEKNEEIKLLRRQINNAVRDGDEERATRLAERIIDTYRVMYFSGLKERVPKELHGRFTREDIGMKREGISPPGSNIPQQAPFK